MKETKAISLIELQTQVKTGIRTMFPGIYWIIAEISEMNTNQSGHCYLELIEKSTESEQIIAKAKATIWAFTFRMLKPYFESVTGQRFSTGIKVMLSVSIEFHELYGFSLNVKDIEPNYTVGDLTRKKQEIIKQLQDEGVFHLNKELEFPIVPQRIAVISSETAAGYGDFVHQLKTNRYGFKYYIKLFKAYMQGEEAEKSIINALDQIFESLEKFDIIVIIRGGGSQADLNCFNSYWLAYHITQFPLPVLTGIGHERDQTIADLVAFNNLKTPTAVA
jgi:exodeoxyribonuclease VII large subunit